MEDDLALEVVVLLGTVAGDQAAAELIVETGILHALVNLLNGELLSIVSCWWCVMPSLLDLRIQSVIVVFVVLGTFLNFFYLQDWNCRKCCHKYI